MVSQPLRQAKPKHSNQQIPTEKRLAEFETMAAQPAGHLLGPGAMTFGWRRVIPGSLQNQPDGLADALALRRDK